MATISDSWGFGAPLIDPKQGLARPTRMKRGMSMIESNSEGRGADHQETKRLTRIASIRLSVPEEQELKNLRVDTLPFVPALPYNENVTHQSDIPRADDGYHGFQGDECRQ